MKRALFFASKFFIVKKTREIGDGLEKMARSLRKPENLLRLSYENKILFVEFKSAATEVLSDIQNILSIASSMIARN